MTDSKEAQEKRVSEPEATRVPEYFLYESCMDMLKLADLIYCVADLRELARKGKLVSTNPESIEAILKQEGIQAESFCRVLTKNKEALTKAFGERCDLYLEAFESLQGSPESHLLFFDDENCNEELVYAITLDSVNKRIEVSFRGSVTPKDWLMDAKISLKKVPNPLEHGDYVTKLTSLQVHAGFYDYLFSVKKDSTEAKVDEIMKRVVEALQQHPGYHLCTTGHSLGAALSTLFAFRAAADPRIPKPVICINFASPRVGNKQFRSAFQSLEKEGKLLCLRVANDKDIITELPAGQSKVGSAIDDDIIFRHVGIELRLYKDRKYIFVYSHDAGGNALNRLLSDCYTWVVQMVVCALLPVVSCFVAPEYAGFHRCTEYLERLQNVSGPLEKIELRELYRDLNRRKKRYNIIKSPTR